MGDLIQFRPRYIHSTTYRAELWAAAAHRWIDQPEVRAAIERRIEGNHLPDDLVQLGPDPELPVWGSDSGDECA